MDVDMEICRWTHLGEGHCQSLMRSAGSIQISQLQSTFKWFHTHACQGPVSPLTSRGVGRGGDWIGCNHRRQARERQENIEMCHRNATDLKVVMWTSYILVHYSQKFSFVLAPKFSFLFSLEGRYFRFYSVLVLSKYFSSRSKFSLTNRFSFHSRSYSRARIYHWNGVETHAASLWTNFVCW